MINAFYGQDKLGVKYNEYLQSTLTIYESLADMCIATKQKMRKSKPVMLKGKALKSFSNNAKACDTHEEAIILLQHLYNNEEKQTRWLSEWREMQMTDVIQANIEASDVDIYT